MIDAAIAMNRFGLGARAGQTIPANPQNWLLKQLDRFDPKPDLIAALPSRSEVAEDYASYLDVSKQTRRLRKVGSSSAKSDADLLVNQKASRKELRGLYEEAVQVRYKVAVRSNTDFPERLVHFWSNHFAISTDELPIVSFAGSYEFEAIRPNILGKFSDLLFAATEHPAMLLFLDQSQSLGPNSRAAKRIARRQERSIGLNENLAREVLELHTLGVRSGYTQDDVTELARALTGRTVSGVNRQRYLNRLMPKDAQLGDTVFNKGMHEPGKRQVMGMSYAAGGAAQTRAILSDLAVHPATAHHIATKLARHFVGDSPPESLILKLESNFLTTGGDLPSLYRILIEAPEAWPDQWDQKHTKFKSPWEWVVSSGRALGFNKLPGNGKMVPLFTQMGQPIWQPGSPAGYADTAETWAGGAALMRRVELAARLGRRGSNRLDARTLGPQIMPGIFGGNTQEAVLRAESPAQGLALLLVSPEFLRR